MIVILGASGHVGSAALDTLVAGGRPVLAVVGHSASALRLQARGVETAVVDGADRRGLADVLRRGRRALLLNPPADPAGDTDARERTTAVAIAGAVADTRLEKVVVVSTYGAQPGEGIGDLSVLHELEQRVIATGVPTAINRGAYYYSNFDALLDTARSGELPSMYPPDLAIPMVDPADLGRAAARRLVSPAADDGIRYVEGPRRYSYAHAARAFAAALGAPVRVRGVPRDEWEAAFREQGFSATAARSYSRMTAASVDAEFDMPAAPERGCATLDDHIAALVGRSGGT